MVDIDTLSRSFYEGIDGTIREHMRQKGVTITRNIYTGFDGE
jgi:hypothetical protein